jgi:hypothetical protein
MVKSQSREDQSYVVNLQYFSCDCLFHEKHTFCKHIYACEDLSIDASDAEPETDPETETDDERRPPQEGFHVAADNHTPGLGAPEVDDTKKKSTRYWRYLEDTVPAKT